MYKRYFLLACIALIFQSKSISQIINGDFESYIDTLYYTPGLESIIDSAFQTIPLDWKNAADNDSNGETGFYRTTDATIGNHAIVLSTWYVYVKTILGQEGTLTSRPSVLTGMYKYIMHDDSLDASDVAVGTIEIFNIEGDTIGTGLKYFDSLSLYTPFSIPIDYQNEDLAHTYNIKFKSSEGDCSIWAGQCKFLFLDDLKFELSTSLETLEQRDKMSVFPNPTRNEVRFSRPFKTCEVYDFQGRLISHRRNRDLITLPQLSGIYLLRVEDMSGALTDHKIIKQ